MYSQFQREQLNSCLRNIIKLQFLNSNLNSGSEFGYMVHIKWNQLAKQEFLYDNTLSVVGAHSICSVPRTSSTQPGAACILRGEHSIAGCRKGTGGQICNPERGKLLYNSHLCTEMLQDWQVTKVGSSSSSSLGAPSPLLPWSRSDSGS